MKKTHLLLGMIILSVAGVNAAQKLTEQQRRGIEEVQVKKIARQKELARPSVYKMLDAAIKEEILSYKGELGNEVLIVSPIIVNWPLVFNILDSMRGVISVNEYGTYEYNYPLLYIAVKKGNVLVAKTLLEKYKADPNVSVFEWPSTLVELEAGHGKETTLLMLARKQGNNAMVDLLVQHGAEVPFLVPKVEPLASVAEE